MATEPDKPEFSRKKKQVKYFEKKDNGPEKVVL